MDRFQSTLQLRQRTRQLLSPRVVKCDLVLTTRCNLCCSYCFGMNRETEDEMAWPVARQSVDWLIRASRNAKRLGISFIGGEAMLRFGLLRDVVEYAKREASIGGKSIGFSMTTNGTLLEKTHLRYFRSSGLRYLLSLDGGPEENDRHRKSVGGTSQYAAIAAKMRMLKRHQPWQGARVTVAPETAARLGRSIRHLHRELAINQFIIGFASGVRWSDGQIAAYSRGLMEAFEFYLEECTAERHRRLRIDLLEAGRLGTADMDGQSSVWGCGAGSGRMAVDTDGSLHGCARLAFAAREQKKLLSIGDVDTGFSKPENRRKLLNHSVDARVRCRDCVMAGRCNGGCYAANLSDTGQLYTPADYYCKLVFAQCEALNYCRRRLNEMGLGGPRLTMK
jgi:uncharacterized protein